MTNVSRTPSLAPEAGLCPPCGGSWRRQQAPRAPQCWGGEWEGPTRPLPPPPLPSDRLEQDVFGSQDSEGCGQLKGFAVTSGGRPGTANAYLSKGQMVNHTPGCTVHRGPRGGHMRCRQFLGPFPWGVRAACLELGPACLGGCPLLGCEVAPSPGHPPSEWPHSLGTGGGHQEGSSSSVLLSPVPGPRSKRTEELRSLVEDLLPPRPLLPLALFSGCQWPCLPPSVSPPFICCFPASAVGASVGQDVEREGIINR